jgi:hypothetical protein
MAFNLKKAKEAGYSDTEIADYLGSQSKFNTIKAREAGYDDAEIISHLSSLNKPKETGVIDTVKKGATFLKDAATAPISLAKDVVKSKLDYRSLAEKGLLIPQAEDENAMSRDVQGVPLRVDYLDKLKQQDRVNPKSVEKLSETEGANARASQSVIDTRYQREGLNKDLNETMSANEELRLPFDEQMKEKRRLEALAKANIVVDRISEAQKGGKSTTAVNDAVSYTPSEEEVAIKAYGINRNEKLDAQYADLPKPEGVDVAINAAGRALKQGSSIGGAMISFGAKTMGADEFALEMLKKSVKASDEARQYPAAVESFTEIKSWSDVPTYLLEGLIENSGMLIGSMGSGAIGAKIGGKTLSNKAAQELTEEAVRKEIARRSTIGATAGAGSASIGMETGSIYSDIYGATGEERPLLALGGGIAAGALDAIPAVMALKTALKGRMADEAIKGIIQRYGVDGLKQISAEGATEFGQTWIEEASKAQATGEDIFTRENIINSLDAMFKGGGVGGAMHVGAQGFNDLRQRKIDKFKKLQKNNLNKLLEVAKETHPEDVELIQAEIDSRADKPTLTRAAEEAQRVNEQVVNEQQLQDDALLQEVEQATNQSEVANVSDTEQGISTVLDQTTAGTEFDNGIGSATPSVPVDVARESSRNDNTIEQSSLEQSDVSDKSMGNTINREEFGSGITNENEAINTSIISDNDVTANDAATSPLNDLPEPTQAQKDAGNYKVGRAKISGLDISIENPDGSTRSGVDRDGNAWSRTMNGNYGYVRGKGIVARAPDKEHVDVNVKPNTAKDYDGDVFIVNQVEPTTGKFDEPKAYIGYLNKAEAEAAYRSNYADDWQGMDSIAQVPMAKFKEMLKNEKAFLKPIKEKQAKAAISSKPKSPATLLTTIFNNGGLSLSEKLDVTGEGRGFAVGGYNRIFNKQSKQSLKGMIESGTLDAYLPYNMRLETNGVNDAFDSTEAYDYLTDKIRNGDRVLPYEVEAEIAANKAYQNADVQEDIQTLSTLDDDKINALLREAGYDEREFNVNQQEYEQETTRSGEQAKNTESRVATSDIVSSQRNETTETIQTNEVAGTPKQDERVRQVVETIVKRRAAANEINKGKQFDNFLKSAKDLLNGETVKPSRFLQASKVFAKDKVLSDAYNQLKELAKPSAKSASVEKVNTVETYKGIIENAKSTAELQSIAKDIQSETSLSDAQVTELDDLVMDKMDSLEGAQNENDISDNEKYQPTGKKISSWVIKDKKTGEVIRETFQKSVADKVNTDKYEAVPILEHLQGLNKKPKTDLLGDNTEAKQAKKAEIPDYAGMRKALNKLGYPNTDLSRNERRVTINNKAIYSKDKFTVDIELKNGKWAVQEFSTPDSYTEEQSDAMSLFRDDLNRLNGDESPFDSEPVMFSRKNNKEDNNSLPKLSAIHNLSEDNLIYADKLGGLSVPSIGIVTDSAGGIDGFGGITLIGGKSIADPAKNPVFSSDAYTSRFPRPEYGKVKSKDAMVLVNEIRDYAKQFDDNSIVDTTYDSMVNYPKPDDVLRKWMDSNSTKALFLNENGITVKPVMRKSRPVGSLTLEQLDEIRPLYEMVDNQLGYDAIVESDAYKAVKEKYEELFNSRYMGKDYDLVRKEFGEMSFSKFGTLGRDLREAGKLEVDKTATSEVIDKKMTNKRKVEFKKWVEDKILPPYGDAFLTVGRNKLPYTLDSIVKSMSIGATKGVERTMTFGAGNARASASVKFKTLEQMRKLAETSIADYTKYENIKKESEQLLEDYRSAVIEFTNIKNWKGQPDTWEALDSSMRAIAKWATGSRTRDSLISALKSEDFNVNAIPDVVINQGIEAGNALINAPVPYFEAKPQRAVGLSEFYGAVIPESTSKEARAILKKNGIKFTEYTGEENRVNAVRQFTKTLSDKGDEVLFSRKANNEIRNKSTAIDNGNKFETGVPVTFNYAHNTESATAIFGKPNKNSAYGRGYEPSGEFVTVLGKMPTKEFMFEGMEYGTISFQNPLVIENDGLNWKKTLSEDFGGLTGKKLSMAVIDAGYDGIVTTENGHTSETINLQTFDEAKAMYSRKDTPTFYSELSKQIDNVKMNKAPSAQWKGVIANLSQKGVKPDEIEWTGINEWLDLQTGSVTKEQIAEYLEGNGVQVSETMLGMVSDEELDTFLASEEGQGFKREAAREYLSKFPKYDQYTVAGGTNYKELLLTLPENTRERDNAIANLVEYRKALFAKYDVDSMSKLNAELTAEEDLELDRLLDEKNKADPTTTSYKSSHWSQSNILAHVRFDERTDAGGNKVLFINEIQSDWAQEGKKYGFNLNPKDKYRHEELRKKWLDNTLTEAEGIEFDRLDESGIGRMGKTPTAPFVTKTDAWVLLAIKRMMRYAAENGFDKVAFINGQQAADLYDLSKRLGFVALDKDFYGFVVTAYQNDDATNQVLQKTVKTESEVADIIGKDATEKILKDMGSGTHGELKRADLKVGGEGMRTFYDQIVPKVAKDVLKKVGGGKVEALTLPAKEKDVGNGWGSTGEDVTGNKATTQIGFTITPEMREKIMGGLPLFSRNANQKGLPLNQVQSIIDELKSKWKNAPPINVIESMQDESVPARVRAEDARLKANGSTGEPVAFITGGQVYILAPKVKNKAAVQEALFHEALGHFGLRGVYGSELNEILDQIVMMRKADVFNKATDYAYSKTMAEARERIVKETKKDVLDKLSESEFNLKVKERLKSDLRKAAEEVLAEMAQTNPKAGFVQRAIAAIRRFLKNIGFDIKLSDNDIIVNYLLPARNYVIKGGKEQRLEAKLQPAYSLSDDTKANYENRIDELFNGGKANYGINSAVVLDRSDVLDLLGHGNKPLYLNESKVADGKFNHGLKPEDWKKIPEWLENPALVFESETVSGRLVMIAPEKVNGAPVRLIIDPSDGDKLSINMLVNAYDAQGKTPFARWINNGALRYYNKAKSPVVLTRSELQLLGLAKPKGRDKKILRYSDLVKYRVENDTNFSRSNNPSVPEETKSEAAQRIIQDKFNRFKVLGDWLKEQGVKLSEAADVYLHETLMWGRVSTRKEDFREDFVKPLVEKTQKANITMEQIGDYLKAQHAPEANKRAREIHGNEEATAYGVTDEEARQAIDEFKALDNFSELKAIANEWRSITDKTKQIKIDAGLLDPEMAKAWESTYSMYVPVKGGDDNQKSGLGKGLHVKTNDKRRLGHEKRDEAIIENILRDHESAIMLDEKNRVGKALIKFALEAGNEEIITIGKPVKRKVLKQGETAYIVQHKGLDIGSFDSKSEANMFVQAQTALGATKADFSVVATKDSARVALQASPLLSDNEVNVYVKGHAIRIQINDEIAAREYKNMGIEHLNSVLSAGREINSWLSKVYTGYSPDFIFTNPVRDAIQGLITLTGNYGGLTAAKVFTNYPVAVKELVKHFKNKNSSELVNAYRNAGGSTGAAYLSDLERIGNDIKKSYEEYQGSLATYKNVYDRSIAEGKSKKIAHAKAALRSGVVGFKKIPIIGHFMKLMESINAITENALRVATYKTLKDGGMSNARAAAQAKNLMNFNRKGEQSNVAGSMYLFFNPSVQGVKLMQEALFTSPHKNQARALSGMMTLAAMSVSALAMMGDEEDKKKWENTPDHVKDSNIVINAFGVQIKIPLPYGYKLFWTLGNVISDAMNGGNIDKLSIRMASSVFENLSPFGNLVGERHGELDVFQVLPTVPKMVLGATEAVNEDGFGSSITPTKWNDAMPDSQLMFRGTHGSIYDNIASKLNSATGGSDYEAGFIDVSPETMKYWVKSLLGGTGQFFGDGLNIGKGVLDGVPPQDVKDIPVIRRFIREPSISDVRSAFWERKNEADAAVKQFSLAKKARDVDAMQGMLDKNLTLISLSKMSTKIVKLANASRDAAVAIKQDETLSMREKIQKIKELEKEEQEVYDLFINQFDSQTKQ